MMIDPLGGTMTPDLKTALRCKWFHYCADRCRISQ